MWTPGAIRGAPLRAFYYITDVDPSWPAERQEEHLRDFSYGALWAISVHEVFPGHFLHYQHLRPTDLDAAQVDPVLVRRDGRRLGALRRAHDGRSRVSSAGSGGQAGPAGRVADSSLPAVVGVRLHCEDLSVEQGVRFFRDEAYLEESAARREAERGTFDPSYVLYSLGKLMVLKLRDDYRIKVGSKFSLRGVSRHAPRQRHGAAVAAPQSDARGRTMGLCWSTRPMPLIRIRVRRLPPAIRADPEVFGRTGRRLSRNAARGPSTSFRLPPPFNSRARASTSPTTRGNHRPTRGKSDTTATAPRPRARRAPTTSDSAAKPATKADNPTSREVRSSVREDLGASVSTPTFPDRGSAGTREIGRRDRVGGTRSRRPLSGIRVCCRCRGGRH